MSGAETSKMRRYRLLALRGQNYRCRYCHGRLSTETATADHIVSFKEGGATERTNIVASCFVCNNAKGNMSYREFVDLVFDDGYTEWPFPMIRAIRRVVKEGDRAVNRVRHFSR